MSCFAFHFGMITEEDLALLFQFQMHMKRKDRIGGRIFRAVGLLSSTLTLLSASEE